MKYRDVTMDFFKGILTILMIICHISQFFPIEFLTYNIYIFIGLISFSGFMFSFGYVSYNSYINKEIDEKVLRNKIMKKFFKTLIAFYTSAIACLILVENNIGKILNVLLLKEVPGFCEYLLSFTIMYVVIYIFRNFFKKINNKTIIFLIIVSLLMTQIDYSYIDNIIIGTIIGTDKYSCFPLAQYFCYFLLGMYLQKNKIKCDKKIYFFTMCGTLIFLFKYFSNINVELRFPPSIYWIIGGFGFVYLLYVFSNMISKNNKVIYYISRIGQNTLSYLIISNLIIFTFSNIINTYSLSFDFWFYKLVLYLFVFVLSIVLGWRYNFFVGALKKDKVLKKTSSDVFYQN